MWLIGNEMGLVSSKAGATAQDPPIVTLDTDFISRINRLMQYARDYQLQKWNRVIPVSTAIIDFPASYMPLSTALQVDVFVSNAGYRGLSFFSLFEGETFFNFIGWKKLSQ